MRVKLPIFCVIAIMMSSLCFASGDFYGTVAIGESDDPAYGATVRLLDTAKVQKYHSITDKTGTFVFKGVKDGKYILHITHVGYKTIDFGLTLNAKTKRNVGRFDLEETMTMTDMVEVVADAILGEMVGDTAQYNADAIKVDSNAKVADLLKKVPGVEVDAKGNVKAQGQNVEKVLVDGRSFFGNDPKTVLENVPAKNVDKVQVYDKASDKDEFIGNDAEKDKKAINLKLKKGKKKVGFGDVSLGGGTRDRYAGTIFANLMNGKLRTSVLGWVNNTNESGVDMTNLFTSGAMSLMGSVMSDYDFDDNITSYDIGGGNSIGGNGMLSKTAATGLNVSSDFGIFKKANLMYFFKKRETDNNAVTKREYFPISDSSEVFGGESKSNNDSYVHSFEARSDEVRVSDHSAFKVNLSGDYKTPKNVYSSTGETNFRSGEKVSGKETSSRNENDTKSFDADVTYRYKFLKPGRTLGVTYNLSYDDNNGSHEQHSLVDYCLIGRRDTINQVADMYSKSAKNSFEIFASEPFASFSKLSFTYDFNLGNSVANSYSYDLNRGRIMDSVYSSDYDNRNQTHDAKLEYRFKKGKVEFNAAAQYQNVYLDGTAVLPYRYNVDYHVDRVLPSASISYKLKDSSAWGNSIGISYHTQLDLPMVGNLQEVLNNTDPLWLSIGNSHLKASDYHSINLNLDLQSADFRKSLWVRLNFNRTENPICDNIFTAMKDTVIDGIPLVAGSHLTRVMNLDHKNGISLNFGLDLPLKLIAGSSVNFGGYVGISDLPTIINGDKYNGKNNSCSFSLGWKTPFSETIEFNIDGDFGYNYDKSSAGGYEWTNEYRRYSLSSGLKWKFYKTAYFRINSSSMFYSGSYYDNGDYDYNLVNCLVGADLLKSKKLNVELLFTDVLNDRKSIRNIAGENYSEFRRKDVLENYVMLRFKYRFNSMSAASKVQSFIRIGG